MSSSYDFDLFVIGGGSAGVRCARIAAGHGARVAVAEARFWGGTCVNVGCVPKKVMVNAAEYGAWAEDATAFGWTITKDPHDWAKLADARDAEVQRLSAIYRRLLEGAGCTVYEAHARFLDPHTIQVGESRVTAERIVIAVGGHPVRPEIPGAELGMISDDVFTLRQMPRRIAILGSGYIAVEFAGVFRGLGAEVDLIYRATHPLRGFDEDIRLGLQEAMEHQGIRQHPGQEAASIERRDGALVLRTIKGEEITADAVLFAVGREPATHGLGLDAAGIDCTAKGALVVDDDHATTAKHIYAIGDVTDQVNLTPVATAVGHALADSLFGNNPRRASYQNVPSAVFSSPPIASVGLTEADAAALGPVDIYLTRFTPLRHTISRRARRSLMKLIVCQKSRRVLGAHMLGDDAPEIMQGLAIAVVAGLTKEDFDRTIGIHPTAAEEFVTLRTRVREAGLAAAAE
jgi:glutathione reductase (NADPH)